jgi:hypothetical protein
VWWRPPFSLEAKEISPQANTRAQALGQLGRFGFASSVRASWEDLFWLIFRKK